MSAEERITELYARVEAERNRLRAALLEIREIAREDADIEDALTADQPYANESMRQIADLADLALAP